jgi:hypothetical protein
MNLRLSTRNSRSARNLALTCLHQCKQCGVVFERMRETSVVSEFSWDRKFMIDKCNTCKNFRLNNFLDWMNRSE